MTQYQPPHINRKLNVQAWWLTALLISINVGLFIWQIISGVDISDPAIKDALHWGADFTPLTFSGQPERLFTSMFFHFGIIHLMLNMWALYIFGNVAEALFGRFSVHDKFHRTLILSGFCLLKIAKISLNSSFFPKPIKR